jgi:hypothetical protein
MRKYKKISIRRSIANLGYNYLLRHVSHSSRWIYHPSDNIIPISFIFPLYLGYLSLDINREVPEKLNELKARVLLWTNECNFDKKTNRLIYSSNHRIDRILGGMTSSIEPVFLQDNSRSISNSSIGLKDGTDVGLRRIDGEVCFFTHSNGIIFTLTGEVIGVFGFKTEDDIAEYIFNCLTYDPLYPMNLYFNPKYEYLLHDSCIYFQGIEYNLMYETDLGTVSYPKAVKYSSFEELNKITEIAGKKLKEYLVEKLDPITRKIYNSPLLPDMRYYVIPENSDLVHISELKKEENTVSSIVLEDIELTDEELQVLSENL